MKPIVPLIVSMMVLISLLVILYEIGHYIGVPTLEPLGIAHTGRFGDEDKGYNLSAFGLFSSIWAFMIAYFAGRIFMYYPNVADAISSKKNAGGIAWLLGLSILTIVAPYIDLTLSEKHGTIGAYPISTVVQILLVLLVWIVMRKLFLSWKGNAVHCKKSL